MPRRRTPILEVVCLHLYGGEDGLFIIAIMEERDSLVHQKWMSKDDWLLINGAGPDEGTGLALPNSMVRYISWGPWEEEGDGEQNRGA